MKTILVVDDSQMDRLLIAHLLRANADWRIVNAEDGAAAIVLLESQPIDLMIADLQMPRVDGLSLVQIAKQRWPHLPIVLVAGSGSEQAALAALRAGAANYSPKSLLQKDLLSTVRFVLEISSPSMAGSDGPVTCSSAAFVLENDTNLIGPLIEHLQSQIPQWSDDSRLQIGMALGEALTNAMHHGNLEVQSCLRTGDEADYYRIIRERRLLQPYCDRRVRVHVQTDEREIRIDVRDEGEGFDPRTVADPTRDENLEKLCGRGLLLIRTFMDEVHYQENGSVVTMIKRRVQSG